MLLDFTKRIVFGIFCGSLRESVLDKPHKSFCNKKRNYNMKYSLGCNFIICPNKYNILLSRLTATLLMGLTDRYMLARFRLLAMSAGQSILCSKHTIAVYVVSDAVAVKATNGTLANALRPPILSNFGRNDSPLLTEDKQTGIVQRKIFTTQ